MKKFGPFESRLSISLRGIDSWIGIKKIKTFAKTKQDYWWGISFMIDLNKNWHDIQDLKRKIGPIAIDFWTMEFGFGFWIGFKKVKEINKKTEEWWGINFLFGLGKSIQII